MKAYRGVDDEIRYSLSYLFVYISSTVCLLLFPIFFFYRLFRPMHNMTRMLVSAQRSCLPEFDRLELVHCIRKLIQVNIIFFFVKSFYEIDFRKKIREIIINTALINFHGNFREIIFTKIHM